MRRAAKRDTAEAPIVEGLRAVGARVFQTLPVDLLVWFRGRFYVIEVKTGNRGTRKEQTAQREFIEATGCPVARTLDEALRAIGIGEDGRLMATVRHKPKERSTSIGG